MVEIRPLCPERLPWPYWIDRTAARLTTAVPLADD
jgi:hypothetical protein